MQLLWRRVLWGLRSLSSSTYNSREPSLFGWRFLCAEAAQERGEGDGGCSKRELMLQEGFTEQQIQAVLDAHPRSDHLSLLLLILKDRGITGSTAGSFISSHLKLLHSNLNQFCQRLEILEDEGICPTLLKKAILQRTGYISSFASPENLLKHLSFLKEMGLSSEDIFLAMFRSRSFLTLSIDTRLKSRWELLSEKGVTKKCVWKLLRVFPRVFSGSEASLHGKIKIVEELGLDLKTGTGSRALGIWFTHSTKKLLAKFDYLKSLGISHEDVTAMVKAQPCLLCMREEHLKKRMEFYLHTLKLSTKDLITRPTLLSSSLAKRVMPRLALLQGLKEKGLLTKPVSVTSALSLSGPKFAEKYMVDA